MYLSHSVSNWQNKNDDASSVQNACTLRACSVHAQYTLCACSVRVQCDNVVFVLPCWICGSNLVFVSPCKTNVAKKKIMTERNKKMSTFLVGHFGLSVIAIFVTRGTYGSKIFFGENETNSVSLKYLLSFWNFLYLPALSYGSDDTKV